MKKFAILLNGNLTVTDRLRGQIADGTVVAADGGMRHAGKLDVCPVCWIGDFDSSDAQLREQWPDVPRQSHSSHKDKTDGELAIDFVIENGAQEIVLVGGLGGQIDQSMGHLMQMIKLARTDIKCLVTNGLEEAWPMMTGEAKFDFPLNSKISIIGISKLEGFSIGGVKWPLDNVNIEIGSTLTMSNEVVETVTVDLMTGSGIVFVSDII